MILSAMLKDQLNLLLLIPAAIELQLKLQLDGKSGTSRPPVIANGNFKLEGKD